jgi:hypothetical protein
MPTTATDRAGKALRVLSAMRERRIGRLRAGLEAVAGMEVFTEAKAVALQALVVDDAEAEAMIDRAVAAATDRDER